MGCRTGPAIVHSVHVLQKLHFFQFFNFFLQFTLPTAKNTYTHLPQKNHTTRLIFFTLELIGDRCAPNKNTRNGIHNRYLFGAEKGGFRHKCAVHVPVSYKGG